MSTTETVFDGLFGARAIGTAAYIHDTAASIAADIIADCVNRGRAVWGKETLSAAMVFLDVPSTASDEEILGAARRLYFFLMPETQNAAAYYRPALGSAIGCYKGETK